MEHKKIRKNGNVNKVQTATNDGFNFGSITKEVSSQKLSKDSGEFDVSNKRILVTIEKSTHAGEFYLKKSFLKYDRGGLYKNEDIVTYKKVGSGGWRSSGHGQYNTYAAAWTAGTKGVITEIHTDRFLGKKLSAVLADTQTYTLKTNVSKYHGDGSDIVE